MLFTDSAERVRRFPDQVRAIISPLSNMNALGTFAALLWRYRALCIELMRRDFRGQYAGQLLGAFWVLVHPLFLIGIYIFVFRVVLQVKLESSSQMPLDYTAYLLSGLVPWLAMQAMLARSTTILLSNANLVKQVVFPIEILPFFVVAVACVPELLGLLIIAIYTLCTYGTLPWTYFLIPILLLMQTALMGGISFLLSILTPFIRDLKDIITVFTVAGVYIIPAFYLPAWVPNTVRPLLSLNPFSHVVWAFQDVFYFGTIAHPHAWILLALGSVISLAVGYRVFSALKLHVPDLL
jgi:lipopolysaccharide transport system permease protein